MPRHPLHRLALLAALVFTGLSTPLPAWAEPTLARVKDVARVIGVRDNELYGYGLVLGLNGTGDRRQNAFFTVQSIQNLLIRQGINLPPNGRTIETKNVAAVMVTAKLPPFAKPGTTIDITVSSLGDATSLGGGTLLLTPLQAADGKVYAVAQGPVSIGGGFSVTAPGTGESVQKNHPTVGRIVNGATVEREVQMVVGPQRLSIALLQPDFTTSARLAQAINAGLGDALAQAIDAATVTVAVPAPAQQRLVEFMAQIEQVEVPTDAPAKVVVNERTGTIIMGSQVKISTVAVSHGNLSIQIKSEFQVSQPLPFAPGGAQTTVVPKTETTVKEEKAPVVLLKSGASIGDLVQGLNAIGATPRDLIAILQAIKRAGALHAELEIM
ncbi:MAG: flagellar basal body P-ring protein FlgI [Candidatus Rokubacteria bacterium]|nr:flagellar basal body P-ring protein FlgI [Candidatus Rokubacteria bacterium]